jgi:hypothetical protein
MNEGALDYEALTLVDQLIIETLTARVRLGERVWTFTNRVGMQLGRLELLGWVNYKSGIVEGTYVAWFTDAGRATLSTTYKPPAHCNKGCAWCDGTSACRYVCVCGHCPPPSPVAAVGLTGAQE